MSERCWRGNAYLNALVQGPVTSRNGSSPHILVRDTPRFADLPLLRSARAVVFTEEISLRAHEALLFMDYRVPFVYGVDRSVTTLEGETSTFYSSDGTGYVSRGRCVAAAPAQVAVGEYCLASSIAGMRYCTGAGASEVAMRGEFVYLQSSADHPITILSDTSLRSHLRERFEDVLDFAATTFRQVLYRFSDFSADTLAHFSPGHSALPHDHAAALGDRGTHRLLGDHRELLAFELELVHRQNERTHNVSVTLPFVRTFDEASSAVRLVRQHFSGPVGCMIEVPALLLRSRDLDGLFDFFIIGASDLCQLLQGADRALFDFSADTASFAVSLLGRYFLPSLSAHKPVYVAGKRLYTALSREYSEFPCVLLPLDGTS